MRPAVAAAGRAVVLAGAVAAAGGTLDCEGHAGVWQPSRGGCASGGRSGGGGQRGGARKAARFTGGRSAGGMIQTEEDRRWQIQTGDQD